MSKNGRAARVRRRRFVAMRERSAKAARPVWVAFQPFCRSLRAAHAPTPAHRPHDSIISPPLILFCSASATFGAGQFFLHRSEIPWHCKLFRDARVCIWLAEVSDIQIKSALALLNLKRFNWFWSGFKRRRFSVFWRHSHKYCYLICLPIGNDGRDGPFN